MNELIIMYPENQLDEVVNKLNNLGFIVSDKPKIKLEDKIIVNLKYEGKEIFTDVLEKIKFQGIKYEVPAIYKITEEKENKIGDFYF